MVELQRAGFGEETIGESGHIDVGPDIMPSGIRFAWAREIVKIYHHPRLCVEPDHKPLYQSCVRVFATVVGVWLTFYMKWDNTIMRNLTMSSEEY